MTDKLADALKAAHNGLKWFRDMHPEHGSPADAELDEQIEQALTAHEAAKAAAPDDVREAFEASYRTGESYLDAESLARRPDGEYEAALARLCFKWFGLGHAAALRQPQGVPREVVDALKEKRSNADFHCCNCPVASMAEAYHQGERSAYDEALALLNAQGV